MSLSYRFITGIFKTITDLICRIDDAELAGVPRQGPLIIYTNHINILEIPIIFTRLQPRKVQGMLLAERWNNPILGWMLQVTEAIPLHRNTADIAAIRMGLEALKKGRIIIIVPEGTRSYDGGLQTAHPGVVLLALHSHAPLLPVAYYGAEMYMKNLSQLKRTDFHIKVGRPFHLDDQCEKVTRAVRKTIIDEMMFQLSRLLPQKYRGYYAGATAVSERHLVFDMPGWDTRMRV